MIIAIDGPAGTGKSTIASILAEKLNITFLNSGGFYRTLTIAILDAGIDYSDEEKTVEFCKKQKIEYTDIERVYFKNYIHKKRYGHYYRDTYSGIIYIKLKSGKLHKIRNAFYPIEVVDVISRIKQQRKFK